MQDIDPDLKYCPQCGDEYRADFIHCASCKIELIDGALRIAQLAAKKKPQHSQNISADDQLVALRKGRMLDMKQLQGILKEEGVPSLITGEGGDCNKGCCGPEVLLHVRIEEAQDALEVLAGEFQRSTDLASHDLSTADAIFDSEAKEVTCPACGHCFSPTSPECPDCGLALG